MVTVLPGDDRVPSEVHIGRFAAAAGGHLDDLVWLRAVGEQVEFRCPAEDTHGQQ
jgi:hypothetical protein